jgi:hypothetical protein
MKKTYSAPFNIKAQSTGEIEAAFATMRTWDLDNDWTEPGAFGAQENIILEGWNHDRKLPVGRGRIFEKSNDAIFEGQFFLQTQNGRDHFEVVKEMARSGTQEFSYTFDIRKSEDVMHDGRPGRRLMRLEVFGVSPVTRGAGINTRLLSLKGGGGTWLSVGLSPANVRAQISELSPPSGGELADLLDSLIIGMQAKELADLKTRFKAAGGPSLLDAWRQQLLSEGHSPAWVETVLANEVDALARRLETNSFAPIHTPGWAMRQALRILSQPIGNNPIWYPDLGTDARSPLVFV